MNNSTRFKLLFAFAIASSFSFGQEKKEIEKKSTTIQARKVEMVEKSEIKKEQVKVEEVKEAEVQEKKAAPENKMKEFPAEHNSSSTEQNREQKAPLKKHIEPATRKVIRSEATPLQEKKVPPIK